MSKEAVETLERVFYMALLSGFAYGVYINLPFV